MVHSSDASRVKGFLQSAGQALSAVGVTFVAISLAGCSVFDARKPVVMTELTASPSAQVIMLTECPIVQRVPTTTIVPILPVIIPIVAALAADVAVNATKAYLARAKTDLSGTWVATGAGAFRDEKGLKGCLVLARGTFGTSEQPLQPIEGSRITSEVMKQVGLTAPPQFYMEVWVDETTQGGATALRLRPQFVSYSGTAAERRGDGVKNVAIVMAMLNASPSSAERDAVLKTAASTVSYVFEKLSLGTEIVSTNPASTTATGRPLSYLDRIVPLAAQSNLTSPVNFFAFAAETDNAGVALSLFSTAFEKQAPTLETAIADYLKEILTESLVPKEPPN